MSNICTEVLKRLVQAEFDKNDAESEQRFIDYKTIAVVSCIFNWDDVEVQLNLWLEKARYV